MNEKFRAASLSLRLVTAVVLAAVLIAAWSMGGWYVAALVAVLAVAGMGEFLFLFQKFVYCPGNIPDQKRCVFPLLLSLKTVAHDAEDVILLWPEHDSRIVLAGIRFSCLIRAQRFFRQSRRDLPVPFLARQKRQHVQRSFFGNTFPLINILQKPPAVPGRCVNLLLGNLLFLRHRSHQRGVNAGIFISLLFQIRVHLPASF